MACEKDKCSCKGEDVNEKRVSERDTIISEMHDLNNQYKELVKRILDQNSID